MARAVIELSGDLSSAMPQLSRQIEGCAYNREAGVMAFRVRAMAVIINPCEIKIHRAEDEQTARILLEQLKALLNDPDLKLTGEGKLS